MTLTERAEFVWDVANGSKRKELDALRADLAAQRRGIEAMTKAVASMPEGEHKVAAWALRVKAQQAWQPVVREFNDAIIAYNQISAEIRKVSLGTYDPGRMSASLGFPMALVWIPLVAASVAGVLAALAMLTDSIRSRSTEVKGYMSQFADIVSAGGGVIEQTGVLLTKTTWSLLVIGGATALYLLYREFRPEIRSVVRHRAKAAAA